MDDPVNAVDPLGLQDEDIENINKAAKATTWYQNFKKAIGAINLWDTLERQQQEDEASEQKQSDILKNPEEHINELDNLSDQQRDKILKQASEVGKQGVDIVY